jgi:CDP-6-deoxy-D-xylo-4-hexulose-3-dehydrase
MIPLVKDTIDKEDIDELIDWLKTYPHLTKGEITLEYEDRWSKMMGCKYSVFVNSGSSANLLMLYSLIESGRLSPGDKVVVPAVSWSTDLAPVIQLGLEAVLCDCNMENLSIDIDHFREIVKKENPKVLLLVSVLGLVPDMGTIVDICEKNNIVLLEDACESLGSESNYKKIGNFGLMSSFSTYFGHHISTIEGGMVCTNDLDMFNILKSIRSHGWDRDLSPEHRNNLRKQYNINDFEALYKFYYCGFNVRATDLQAFLGLGQLKKLDNIVKTRNKNYNLYRSLLKNDFWSTPQSSSRSYISNFAYPVIHPERDRIVKALNKNNIAVRPLICGSLEKQPMWQKRFPQVSLQNADTVDSCGLYLPNNHQISEEEIRKICNIINQIIEAD